MICSNGDIVVDGLIVIFIPYRSDLCHRDNRRIVQLLCQGRHAVCTSKCLKVRQDIDNPIAFHVRLLPLAVAGMRIQLKLVRHLLHIRKFLLP